MFRSSLSPHVCDEILGVNDIDSVTTRYDGVTILKSLEIEPPYAKGKIPVDDVGRVTITNDGATVLSSLEIEPPAAKIPDDDIGDVITRNNASAYAILRMLWGIEPPIANGKILMDDIGGVTIINNVVTMLTSLGIEPLGAKGKIPIGDIGDVAITNKADVYAILRRSLGI